ncbi:Gfo/Idh/MocA family protein [Qingshengfaniella alkalisoli]|uniref:Gfo/Idh/MocA family oxidoreductase n=1 Tax=Qingshengfaniella alkalisoli TaxID=2599296 RepID=A0A5B8IZP3_9RHOB|nr:Gfo/Idh/MocA family oxidoreductase [Qingshengfaniella alkalisoli]QDY71542.1 Gfo/Idh/MocA family oxidoreductase [Qingshengfaniella alkalisoli]
MSQSQFALRKPNVVLIGLGMVSGTHIKALADLGEHVNFYGIASRNPDKVAQAARQITEETKCRPKPFGSIQDIADDPAVDFVILTTPPNARRDIVSTLAHAGKHILMEKPIERDLRAATDIVEMCEDAGITLGVTFQHRFRVASEALADRIASGVLGPIHIAEIDVPWWRDQSYYDEPGRGSYARDGGGVMISQAIHTMDLALSLTGPVQSVSAFLATSKLHRMESEDFVCSGLTFETGAIGSLNATTAAYPGRPESIRLHCAKASATLCAGVLTIDWHDGNQETIGATAGTGGGADPMAFTHEWHRDTIADFIDAIDRGRAPRVTGREALRTHELIDALVLSAKEKRHVDLTELRETQIRTAL